MSALVWNPLLAAPMVIRSVCLAALGALVLGCSSADSPAPQRLEPVGSSAEAITTTDALARADQWVTAKLLYCQSANHQPDYDTSCSSVCNRQDNPAWDPYRSDCSGFVSWAWGLPSPGRVTSEFAPFDTSISHTIQGIDLQPGDALNLTSGGHIILFVQWVTKGTEAEFYEEPGCSSPTPYAHSFTSSLSINGSSVDVSWFGEAFTAIRYDSITSDQPPTGSLAGAACDTITGTASDPDSPSMPLEIDLTFDAPTGQTGSGTMTQVANSFSFQTPLGLKDGAKHTVYAYAKDAQTQVLQLLPGSPRSFTCAPPAIPPGIKRHVPSPAAMTAWKIDPLLAVAKEPLAAIQSVPPGPDFPASPTVVISDDGSPDVWVIDALQGGAQVRRHVIDPASMTAWSLAATKWTAAQVNAFPQGIDWPAAPFVAQGTGAPEIYVIDTAPGTTPPPNTNPPHGNPAQGSAGGCNTSNDGRADGWLVALVLFAFAGARKRRVQRI